MYLIAHSRKILVTGALLMQMQVFAQSLLFPTDYFFDVNRQKALAQDTTQLIHTSLQPFLYDAYVADTLRAVKPGADAFFDKVLYEDLVEVRHIDRSSGYDRKFNLLINPILNFSYGKDVNDTAGSRVQTNTRGFWIKGELGKKLIFESAFMENQAYTPEYIYAYSKVTGVVPGQGRWKNFKTTGFDYASAYGILNFAVSKNFTVRLGHGKQKVGNGYRSLLLSDNSFNYPYLQFVAGFFRNKLQYSQTYALLMNLWDGGAKTPPNTEPIFQKKAASFQHVSLHVGKRVDVYLFQGMTWKATDSLNVMHLNAWYADPVMFTHLVKYGFNSRDNHILAGGGFELRPIRKAHIYGQLMYDGTHDLPSGRVETNWGMQAGAKLYDLFGVRDLFFQAETNILNGLPYNSPGPYYTHYNQVLTTPAILSNEFIGMLSYTHKRFFVQAKYIFQSDNSSQAQMNYFDAKLGYMVNPRYNLTISAGSTTRSFLSGVSGAKASEMELIYIGLRSSLYNLYYDF